MGNGVGGESRGECWRGLCIGRSIVLGNRRGIIRSISIIMESGWTGSNSTLGEGRLKGRYVILYVYSIIYRSKRRMRG